MRVIVTGGAGFIGSALVRHLVIGKAYTVLNIDNLTYAATLGSLRAVEGRPGYHFLKADIADGDAMLRAIFDFRPDRVIHLAAESHVDRSITGARAFVETNIVGTFTLLESARRYWQGLPAPARDAFRFLHVSTDEVYGALGDEGSFTETSRYDPSSPYAATKAASDHLAKAWTRTYGMPVIVSNCSNNYGPFHFPEKLIPLAILNALEARPLPVYGDGSQVRDWLHVEDHVRALDLIAERGRAGETYNIGGRNERTNSQVLRSICGIMDELRPRPRPYRDLISHVPDRPGHDRRYAIDARKLEGELGWKALESFDSGIEKTVRWYLENDWWWRPLRERYDGRRLGRPEPSPQAVA